MVRHPRLRAIRGRGDVVGERPSRNLTTHRPFLDIQHENLARPPQRHPKLPPVGRELWVTLWGSSQVLVLDVQKRTVSGQVTAGSLPHHIAATPDGSQAWVTNHGSGDVSVFA